MKKDSLSWKIISSILIFAISTWSPHIIINYLDLRRTENIRMQQDFIDLKKSLEELNDNIAGLLLGDEKLFKGLLDTEMLAMEDVDDYRNAVRTSFRREKEYASYSYIYNVLYHVNSNVKVALQDGFISEEEQEYLEALFSYNQALIQVQTSVINNESNYEKKKYYKGKVFVDFSLKADELLENDKYAVLLNYNDIFSKNVHIGADMVSREKAQEIVEEIAGKYISEEISVSYDPESQEDESTYVFNQYSFEDLMNHDKCPYEMSYDKKTNSVEIFLRMERGDRSGYSQEGIEERAQEIIKKISEGTEAVYNNYHKEVLYDFDKRIDRIEYKFIRKIDNIYDERKRIDLAINNFGRVAHLKIENVLDSGKINIPSITKEKILAKIPKRYPVKDCLLIRNVAGKLEFQVELYFNNVIYAIVFDANTGEQKYVTDKVRAYSQKRDFSLPNIVENC